MAATKTKSASPKKSSSTTKPSPKKVDVDKEFKGALKELDKLPALRKTVTDNRNDLDEVAVPDIQKFLRDNPSLRVVDNSRRTLPVEEFPAGADERKARENALIVIEEVAKALAKVGEGVQGLDPVLDAKIRDARRVLIA